jgi:hypothetical protein
LPFHINPFHFNDELRMETDMVFLLNMLNMTDEEPLPKERKHTVTPFVLPSSIAARSSARSVAPT